MKYFENIHTLDELKKQYPGITAEKDIEKKSWERKNFSQPLLTARIIRVIM